VAYDKTSYLHHTAIRVKDIHWHIRFFKEALGMPVDRTQGSEEDPVQVWTVGGVQLVSAKDFEGPEGRMVHLGINCEDLDAALDEVYSNWGGKALPQGRAFVELPSGLQIELMQAPKED